MFHTLENNLLPFPIKIYPKKSKKHPNKMESSQTSSPIKLYNCQSDVLHSNNQPKEEVKLGSVNQYINLGHNDEPLWALCKNNGQQRQVKRYDIAQAERILLDNTHTREEKVAASKCVAQGTFKRIYGEKLRKIEQEQRQKENLRPKQYINLSSLEVVMNQMEHNPRSQSILLRKEELEKFWEFGRQKTRKLAKKGGSENEGTNIEIIHHLKNHYSSLKGVIIPTKSQEYDYFVSFYSQQNQNKNEQALKTTTTSGFFKNLMYDLRLSKFSQETKSRQAESFQKFKAYKHSSSVIKHCPSIFVKSNEQLIMQNVAEMSPPIFMFMLSQCLFKQMRVIRLKCIRIDEDLLFLFLDYLRAKSAKMESMHSFELSSIVIQNRLRFSQKLAIFLKEVSLKTLKLESMELCTGEFNRIAHSLAQIHSIEEISLRHNRIDILGVRSMQGLAKTLPKLKTLDVRNNDIPHYANLRDKSPLILFF